MFRHWVPLLFLSALVLAAPGQVRAEIYKWIDERGVVNYGDRPPPQAKSSRPLDLDVDGTTLVPGIPKEELLQLRERDAGRRLRQLEAEVEELQAREATRGARSVTQPPDTGTYWYPVYGYPGYGYGRRLDGRFDAGAAPRPTHPIAKPLPSQMPKQAAPTPHLRGRTSQRSQESLIPVRR